MAFFVRARHRVTWGFLSGTACDGGSPTFPHLSAVAWAVPAYHFTSLPNWQTRERRVPQNSRRSPRAHVGAIRSVAAPEDNTLRAIEALLSSAALCIPCFVARTGLAAWDVEIAM